MSNFTWGGRTVLACIGNGAYIQMVTTDNPDVWGIEHSPTDIKLEDSVGGDHEHISLHSAISEITTNMVDNGWIIFDDGSHPILGLSPAFITPFNVGTNHPYPTCKCTKTGVLVSSIIAGSFIEKEKIMLQIPLPPQSLKNMSDILFKGKAGRYHGMSHGPVTVEKWREWLSTKPCLIGLKDEHIGDKDEDRHLYRFCPIYVINTRFDMSQSVPYEIMTNEITDIRQMSEHIWVVSGGNIPMRETMNLINKMARSESDNIMDFKSLLPLFPLLLRGQEDSEPIKELIVSINTLLFDGYDPLIPDHYEFRPSTIGVDSVFYI